MKKIFAWGVPLFLLLSSDARGEDTKEPIEDIKRLMLEYAHIKPVGAAPTPSEDSPHSPVPHWRARLSIKALSIQPEEKKEGYSLSSSFTMSADGRYVTFESPSPMSTHPRRRIYRLNTETGESLLINTDPSGNLIDGVVSSINSDGRFVAFDSPIPEAEHGRTTLYLKDTVAGTLSEIGDATKGSNRDVSLSSDGRYAAFTIYQDPTQVFVRDTHTGRLIHGSTNKIGEAGDNHSFGPVISKSGRFVVFESSASNLLPNSL